MPNSRRFHLASIPQHLVQRGNNRHACFLDDADFSEYLLRLAAASRKHEVAIHAYVLMSNHVHLLATPARPEGIGKLMQAVGSGYVRSFNAKHSRSGTLWDSRYFSSLVGTDVYLWNCHRYVELNPVRAGIVADPGAYRWSSHLRNAYGHTDPVVTPHPAYLALSRDDQRLSSVYRDLFQANLPDSTISEIRDRLRQERAFGDEQFLASIEAAARRSPRCRGPGRPRGVRHEEPGPAVQLTISDLI